MSSDTPSGVPRRELSDPRALRALSHPIRLSLLEVLDREGPLTATAAGELIGESPASCSFHLRTLARYGFVEEAEGGRGRQRPWRVRRVMSQITEDDLTPEGRLAAEGLVELLRQREQEWLRRWQATRDTYPAEWRAAATENISTLHLTAAELERLSEAIIELTAPYTDRDDPASRPTGTLPVALTVHAVPLQPPRTAPAGRAVAGRRRSNSASSDRTARTRPGGGTPPDSPPED